MSTVGIDERVIREYIRNQEQNDQNYDQGRLFKQHQQLDQLNYRFERFTMEASGFAGGDSLTLGKEPSTLARRASEENRLTSSLARRASEFTMLRIVKKGKALSDRPGGLQNRGQSGFS